MRLPVLVLTGVVVLSVSGTVSAQGPFPDPSTTYFIETANGGMCGRMQDASSSDRTPVLQRPCGSTSEFQFRIEPARDGYFKIRTANGQCLHVQEGAASASGSARGEQIWRKGLWQWSCQDTDEFLFQFPDVTNAQGRGYRLIKTKYDTCFHVRTDPAGGAEFWTWRCQPESQSQREFWFRFAISTPASRPAAVGMITGTGSYNGPPGFDRGMQTTQYCGNDPESWVRGSVTLDTSNGRVQMTLQLETDSTSAGPKGRVRATARDESGRALVEFVSDEIGRGGKAPGRAAIQTFSSALSIRPDIAGQARSVTLVAECTGRVQRLFNIRIGDVENAFKIVVKYLTGGQ